MNYCKAKIDKLETSKRIRSIIVETSLTIEDVADKLGFGSPRIIYYQCLLMRPRNRSFYMK